jgi:hypothetical protein
VVVAKRMRIAGAGIGVGSHDRAEVHVEGLELEGAKLDLAVDDGSSLRVDGREVPAPGTGRGETLVGAAAP